MNQGPDKVTVADMADLQQDSLKHGPLEAIFAATTLVSRFEEVDGQFRKKGLERGSFNIPEVLEALLELVMIGVKMLEYR